jgi:DNA-3-methyladenine glycosylase I
VRCFGEGDPLYAPYHDDEWGRPKVSEQELYEKVCLEGFQAGLAWITVLRKRDALREVFLGFDPSLVVDVDIEPLMLDPRLIRARAKLTACVRNAEATIALRADGGLVDLVWSYRSDTAAPTSWADVPGFTPESVELSKALKKNGFTFVGPTTAYSLMQACGIVNDHLLQCDVRDDVEALRQALLR